MYMYIPTAYPPISGICKVRTQILMGDRGKEKEET